MVIQVGSSGVRTLGNYCGMLVHVVAPDGRNRPCFVQLRPFHEWRWFRPDSASLSLSSTVCRDVYYSRRAASDFAAHLLFSSAT